MKKTIGGILGIGGFLLFVGGIVCLGLELEGPIGMVLLVLGLVACIVGFALIIQPNPEDAKRMEEFKTYKTQTGLDYLEELKQTKETYIADPKRNERLKVARRNGPWNKEILKQDCRRLRYAVVINGFKEAFYYTNDPQQGAFILWVFYSTDKNMDPITLKKLAQKHRGRINQIMAEQDVFFTNEIVAPELYLTSMFVDRTWLPAGYVTGWLLPIVANPEKFESVHLIPAKYWTKALVANNMDGNKIEQKLVEESAVEGKPNAEEIFE